MVQVDHSAGKKMFTMKYASLGSQRMSNALSLLVQAKEHSLVERYRGGVGHLGGPNDSVERSRISPVQRRSNAVIISCGLRIPRVATTGGSVAKLFTFRLAVRRGSSRGFRACCLERDGPRVSRLVARGVAGGAESLPRRQ